MEEDSVIYCVKCSGEVEEKEDGYGTRVGSNEEFICDFKTSGLFLCCAVDEIRIEMFHTVEKSEDIGGVVC